MLIDNPINSFELVFPVLEIFHIAGFAVAIGLTAAVDFRILGFGLMQQTPSQIAKSTGYWMLGGLVVAIFTGLGLYSSDPDMYYLNRSFQVKMALLLIAILFHYLAHGKATKSGVSAAARTAAACTSLALWFGIIAGAIFIGFV